MDHISEIRAANRSDRAQCEAVLTLAFAADPTVRWAMSAPATYFSTFMPLVTLFGGKAMDTGTADVIGDFAGLALWLPPGSLPEDEAIGQLFERNLPQPGLGHLLNLFEKMASFHPPGPHWYLPLAGVDPARQGQGLGTRLMRHGLARCDRAQELAYLEATNPGCRALYERMGFRQLGEIRSGSSPPTYPMLREPR